MLLIYECLLSKYELKILDILLMGTHITNRQNWFSFYQSFAFTP